MKKLAILMFAVLTLVGCSKEEFKTKFTETSIGTYAESFDDVSKFSNVYGMWKDNIDTLYIQAGNDEYTNTYLLDTMPSVYKSVIKSLNKYDMKAYALLNDSNVWLTTEDGEAIDEVYNILSYNKTYEEERFKGININVDMDKATIKELKAFYANLEKTREIIDTHNNAAEDNLILSINANKELLENNVFFNVGKIIDKIIYEDKNSSVEDIEKLLSTMDEYNNEVVIVVDSDEDFFDNNYVSILKGLDKKLKRFNKYESFSGFVINDYDKYHNFLKKKIGDLNLN